MGKFFLVLLLAAVTSSCGKNVTVNLAEAALLWRVDDFFDIDRSQRTQIKSDFRSALQEINDKAIPELEPLIFSESLMTKSCDQVTKDYVSLKPKIEVAWGKVLQHTYSFIDSVTKKQIEYFIEKVQEDIDEDEDELKNSSELAHAKIEKRTSRTIDLWEELIGELSPAQTDKLKEHIRNSKNLDHLFIQSRKKNLIVVKAKSEAQAETEVKSFMKTYLIDWEDQQTPELKKANAERRKQNETFYLNFFCAANPEQKKHFQNTVRDYLNLFRKVYIKK